MQEPNLHKKVREIMTTRVVAATRQYRARDLAVLLQSGRFSGIPIIESGSKLVGMVTEFDLMTALLDKKDLSETTVEDIMTSNPLSVDDSTTAESAMKIMIDQGVIRLPVVRDGRLIGLIARSDILDHMIGAKPAQCLRSIAQDIPILGNRRSYAFLLDSQQVSLLTTTLKITFLYCPVPGQPYSPIM